MKEKPLRSVVVLLSLLLVFAVSVVVASAQSTIRPEGQVGRYQVVTVAGDASQEAQVFKIDTMTGRVWVKAYLMEGTVKTVAWPVTADYPTRPTTSPSPR